MITNKLLAQLSKPFASNMIHWRVGSTTKDGKRGMALAYLDARDVMDRLDNVCGTNWSDSYVEVAGRVVCSINIDGVIRTDGPGDTQVEAEKGGLSDAFKRAAVKWGVGRYLYRLDSEWVALDQKKRIITPPEFPEWALSDEDEANPNIDFVTLERDDKTINQNELTSTQADLIEGILELEGALIKSDRLTAESKERVRKTYAKVLKLEAAAEQDLKTYYNQLTDFQRSN